MVSSRFHAFCLGICSSFCFVKTSLPVVLLRRVIVPVTSWLIFWKMIFSAKAILFDMDGVLMDSTPSVERVWRTWAAHHGFDPEHIASLAHGRRSIETIRSVAPELDAEKENVAVEQMEIDDKEGVTALPGAVELLTQLPPHRFAVVTSATRPLALARLGYAGIPVPRHMITANDVVHGKPSPEPFLKGAALLGFAPAQCLVFEDSSAGIAAARSAEMQAIGLQTTYSADQLQAAYAIIGTLADVKATLRDGKITLELSRFAIAKS
jgi:mannitol-1-/sugar-/sorbitol-6-phosphatase